MHWKTLCDALAFTGMHCGLQLKRLIPDSPAEKQGEWRVGDVITSVNGQKLSGNRLAHALPQGLPEYTFRKQSP